VVDEQPAVSVASFPPDAEPIPDSASRITAAYSVAGASFTCDLVLESPPGPTIDLAYNPKNPADCVLPDSATHQGVAWFLLAAAVLAFIVALL
jgi:hypothetical protein